VYEIFKFEFKNSTCLNTNLEMNDEINMQLTTSGTLNGVALWHCIDYDDDEKDSKYKLNAGPQYAFYSLILPGWGSAKVSSGERGYLEGLAYLTGLASAGLFKVLERSSYSEYEDATTQVEAVANFDSATGSRRLFLISLGLAGVMYVYDFSWSVYRGFKNIKKASEIKKKIKNKPIEVKTSNF
jgi:hypothetical protein